MGFKTRLAVGLICAGIAGVGAWGQEAPATQAPGGEAGEGQGKEPKEAGEVRRARVTMQLNLPYDKESQRVVTPRYPGQAIGFYGENKLVVRNLALGRIIGECPLKSINPLLTVLSAKGDLVASVSHASGMENMYTLSVYSVSMRREIKSVKVDSVDEVTLIDFAGDDRVILTATGSSSKRELRSVNYKTGEVASVKRPEGVANNHPRAPYTVSPDGTLLAVLLNNREGGGLALYDTRTLTAVDRKFEMPQAWVPWALRFTPDSSKLVLLANDNDSANRLGQFLTFDVGTGALSQSVGLLFKIQESVFDSAHLISHVPVQFSADGQLALVMGLYVCSGSTFELIYKLEFNNKQFPNNPPNVFLGNDYVLELQTGKDGKKPVKYGLFQLPYAKVKKALEAAQNSGSTRDAGLSALKAVDMESVPAGVLTPGDRVPLGADGAGGLPGVNLKQLAVSVPTEKPVFFMSQQPGAPRPLVAAFDPYKVRQKGESQELYSVDLKAKRFNGPLTGVPSMEQVSGAPDSSRVSVVTPRAEGDRIDVFSTSAFFGKAVGLVGFSPYVGRKIAWSRLVTPDLLLTMSDTGVLAGWSVEPLKLLYRFEVDPGMDPLISAGGKHVLVSKGGVIYAIHAGTGGVIGPVAGPVPGLEEAALGGDTRSMPRFGIALSASGTKLLVSRLHYRGEEVTVWDLSQAQGPVTEVLGLAAWARTQRIASPVWVTDRYVRTRAGFVYDVEGKKVVALSNDRQGGFMPLGDGTMLYADTSARRLAPGPGVPAETLAKMEKVKPEDMWYIDPGTSWELVIKGSLPEGKKAELAKYLKSKAAESKLPVAEASDNKMIFTVDHDLLESKGTKSGVREEYLLTVGFRLESGRKDRSPIVFEATHQKASTFISDSDRQRNASGRGVEPGVHSGEIQSHCVSFLLGVPAAFVDYDMLDTLAPGGMISRPGTVMPEVTPTAGRAELAQISKVLPVFEKSLERLREVTQTVCGSDGKRMEPGVSVKMDKTLAVVKEEAKQLVVTSASVPTGVSYQVDQGRRDIEFVCVTLDAYLAKSSNSEWSPWQTRGEVVRAVKVMGDDLPGVVGFLKRRHAFLTEMLKK